MKTYLIIFFSIIVFYGNVVSQSMRDLINQQIQSIGLNYREETYIEVNKAVGLAGGQFVEGEIEDPYGTLKDCVLFTAYQSTQRLDSTLYLVGVLKNSKIIWYYPIYSEELASADIYSTIDLNLEGKVDIVVECKHGTEGLMSFLWIFSWDGTKGELINDIDEEGFSMIEGYYHSYDFSDLDGDGIMEIRSYPRVVEDSLNLASWSWNGQKYGKWPNTPTLSFKSWLPAKNAMANVNCIVLQKDTIYQYEYNVQNKVGSKRRIENFHIPVNTMTIGYSFGSWHSSGGDYFPIVSWDMIGLNYINMFKPGEKKTGFIMSSKGLPAINNYYVQSERGLMEIDFDLNDLRDDIINNSTSGITLSPQNIPNPFIPSSFLDTLTSLTTRSRDLGWIKQQPISDKYTGYFSTAKTALQKNKISLTHSTLTQALHDVDVDSSSTLTSEAYALIKYNTEYLLAHLPNTISALDMLDTLRVRTDRTIPNNTPCGRDFKEDLIENIAKAKKELIEKDTIACALYIKMYEKQICEKYNHRKGKPCVTTDEYNYLYPYAESIVELLLPLPPKCGGSCKDKLFDLKSEIGRCTKKGYCSRGEFENGMEEQIDKAVKCIENKDSTGTATCLGLFEQEVQQTYEQTKKRYDERKYVKPEGYITLYYKAEYILEDLEH